jgi:hypothetical protein
MLQRTRSANIGAAAVAACLGALALVGAQRTARAQGLNLGFDLGAATRSSTPSLGTGVAAGAHAEYKIIPMLSVGAYFLHYDLPIEGAPNTVQPVSFNTFGGRVRFTLPLPKPEFRPYAYLGMGRVGTRYPAHVQMASLSTGGPGINTVSEVDGRFVEVPIGLGFAYQLFKAAQVFGELALRPGFAFAGGAHEPPAAWDQTKMGFTALAGAALDFDL